MSLSKTPTREKDPRSEEEIKEKIDQLAGQLGKMQERLYAKREKAVLIILQGLDAAGKDNTVKHVFSAVNPSGICVKGFKVPSEEERAHDFLWRVHKNCPERGMMQIFNRSHYEDVLVPVVEQGLKGKALKARYQAINAFEQLLVEEGTLVFKFFLHVSAEAQRERFAERRDDPAKRWKYNEHDLDVFNVRDAYLHQYDKVFKHCAKAAPWHIIPADDKPEKNYRILKTLLEGLEAEGL